MTGQPTVTVAIPTYNESQHIDACLSAVTAQTYPDVIEVLVVDGGSEDDTRALATCHPGVRVINNPGRIQSAALNIAIEAAKGDVLVRVDGHCELAPDYVQAAVRALAETGAAMVGGGMTPVAVGAVQRGIAEAMGSAIGAGPARFHTGGAPGWVDTVYLGVYRTDLARAVGGYATDVGVNEDAEFAHRIGASGGVYYDPAIQSTYVPRSSVAAVAKQFYRYGRSRAKTVRRHPDVLAPRQLAAPALVLGLVSPWRKQVAIAYGVVVLTRAAMTARRDPVAGATVGATLPAMHLSWGIGFLQGIVTGR